MPSWVAALLRIPCTVNQPGERSGGCQGQDEHGQAVEQGLLGHPDRELFDQEEHHQDDQPRTEGRWQDSRQQPAQCQHQQ